MVIPQNPVPVAPGRTETTTIFVLLPERAFTNGERQVTITIDDQAGFTDSTPYLLAGPQHHDHEKDAGRREEHRQ